MPGGEGCEWPVTKQHMSHERPWKWDHMDPGTCWEKPSSRKQKGFPSSSGKICLGVSLDLLQPGWKQGHFAESGGHHTVGGGSWKASSMGRTFDQGRPGREADTCLSSPSTRRPRAWKASVSEQGEGCLGEEADTGHRDPADSFKVPATVV